jgi:hypothetical protein
MAKARSGGGINSRVNTRPSVKVGPPKTNVINPGGADALGKQFAGRVTPLSAGTMPQVPLGNAVALNVGKGGPGTGRKVYAHGTQGTHGPVNPGQSPERRDILSEFGPEAKGGG